MMQRTLLVLALMAGLACAHRKARHGSSADPPPTDFALEVVNHHWLDVEVFIIHDGVRTRVGTVTAASKERFVLPGRMLGTSRDIFLVGEAIGSPAVARTDRLIIQPGQYIEWTLETDLSRSSVGVY